VEQIDEFKGWLNQMLIDARNKLELSDRTISFMLFDEALKLHLKGLTEEVVSV